MIAIDASERTHAQTRLDARSAGPARTASSVANRVLCRQALAEHVARGGVDVSDTTKLLSHVWKRQDGVLAVTSGKRRATSSHPGSAMLRFQNMKEHAYKSLHALIDL